MSEPSLACEPARLDWSQASGPRATDYGDVYFSAEDGLAETAAVFLRGCGLPDAWQGRSHFMVGELGFGTGLNALALWQLWRDTRAPGAWLDFVSLEKHPLSREEAARAFRAWPQLQPLSDKLLAQWPPRLKGAHRLVFPEDGFAITVFHDEAEAALAQMDCEGRVDAWFLDGFAPDRNEAMWSQAVFDRIGALSAPGARVGTFTVAGAVRRGLAAAGFDVSKQPGFGRKRERLEAVWPGEARPHAAGPGRIAVIGGGIAGASLCRALRARGREVVLLDRSGLASGASGAPAGLLTPRLEKADRPHVRATLAAFAFARNLYAGLDGFFCEGVTRLAKDAREAERFEAIASMMDGSIVWTGEALDMPEAGRFDPARLVSAIAGETPMVRARVGSVKDIGDAVSLCDEAGEEILIADAVVLAAGAGAARHYADISPSAGQVAVFEGEPPDRPVTWGGYACRAPGGVLVGATHVKGECAGETDAAIADFRAGVARHLPGVTLGRRVTGLWSGVRASTPDRLPVAGQTGPRCWMLGGLGSRGFAHAPLLAEMVASAICGGGPVLERDGRDAFDPARFEHRRQRRAQG